MKIGDEPHEVSPEEPDIREPLGDGCSCSSRQGGVRSSCARDGKDGKRYGALGSGLRQAASGKTLASARIWLRLRFKREQYISLSHH